MLRSAALRTAFVLVTVFLATAAFAQPRTVAVTDPLRGAPQLQQWSAPSVWYNAAPRAEASGTLSPEATLIAAPTLPYTFTPIAPCRKYDSRATGAGGPLLQGVNRAVPLVGPGPGTLPDCGIPANAVAASVNITVFNIAGATGNATFKVDTVLPPLVSWINYPPTETQRANAGTVALNLSGQIIVQVAQGAGQVDFIVDTNGYYTATQLAAWINAGDGSIVRSLHAISSSHFPGNGSYTVEFDRDVTPCFAVGSVGLPGTSGGSAPGFLTTVGEHTHPEGLFIQTFDKTGAVSDLSFAVTVTCPP